MVAQQPFGHEVGGVLAAQLGLVTRRQALDCGETVASIKAKVSRGEWVRVTHGVYRATLFPAMPEQRVLAQCLRSPERTWASHRTAAWLHQLGPELGNTITLTTCGQLKSHSGIEIHRTSQMPPCDVTKVNSVPVTAIERTLLDLASNASDAELEFALDEALSTRQTSLEKIEWRLRRVGGRGTAGSAALGRALRLRRRLGSVDSHLERRFLNLVRKAELPMPELQYPITLAGRTVLADFAFPEHHLLVEVMGYRWHGGRDRWERDLIRSSELGAAGWRIIYITKGQITNAPRHTLNRLRDALGYGPLFVL